MRGTYPILLGGEPVGQVDVERQGLYYHYNCRCRLSGEVFYKLTVTCGGKTESLGILIPDGEEFVLRTRLSSKRLGQGVPEFRAVPRRGEVAGKFIPVYPDEPFAYISRLQNAFLASRNGQIGVVIRDP